MHSTSVNDLTESQRYCQSKKIITENQSLCLILQIDLKEHIWLVIAKNEPMLAEFFVYVIELALKLSPLPLSVQRKNLGDAQALYNKVRQCMEREQPRLLEVTCEKVEDKKVTVLVQEVLAVQIYEKTAATGGTKRPGFSFEA